MDEALEERARGNDHGAGTKFPPARGDHPRRRAILHEQILDRLRDDFKIGLRADGLLHMPAIELAVRLRARPLHGRPLGAVQHAELDARLVDHAAHQPVERIDLADEMPLAKTADRGIARHLADGFELMRDERRARAHARRRGGRLAARVPASHNDDVECVLHDVRYRFPVGLCLCRKTCQIPVKFHVKRQDLFTDTELGKDLSQHILYIEPPGQTGQRVRRDTQILCGKFCSAALLGDIQKREQSAPRLFDFLPVPRARDERSFGEAIVVLREGDERAFEAVQPLSGLCRDLDRHMM